MKSMVFYLRCLTLTAALAVAGCASNIPPGDGSPGIEPKKWFPADYQTSRDRFRADCKRLARAATDICGKWRLAKSKDPDLTIDYGIFARGGDRLLVVQSGIHGTEAASGAAVQAYVGALVRPAFDQLGWERRAGESGHRHLGQPADELGPPQAGRGPDVDERADER